MNSKIRGKRTKFDSKNDAIRRAQRERERETVQSSTKRWTCFAKHYPGRARQKFLAALYSGAPFIEENFIDGPLGCLNLQSVLVNLFALLCCKPFSGLTWKNGPQGQSPRRGGVSLKFDAHRVALSTFP